MKEINNTTQRLKASSHYSGRQESRLYVPDYFRPGEQPKRFAAKGRARVRKVLGPVVCNKIREAKDGFHSHFPFSGLLRKRCYSNNRLSIDITTVCNLRCFNCESSVRQAPANDNMSVSQVEKFVNEAIALNYCWDRISLFGGEPTLHPQFFEIVDALKPYKAFNPDCYIDLVTNGAGHKVKSVLAKLPDWVKVQNSEKTEGKESYAFGSYNVAPVDTVGFRFFSDFSKGCRLLESCFGLGLSMYGYYPCSPCMHVDRVFGFNIGIKQLSSVTDEALRAQMAILCRYCGWFKHPDISTTVVEKISRSWQKVYAEYKRQKPVLSRY